VATIDSSEIAMTDLAWLERSGWKPATTEDFSFGDPAAEAAAALRGTVLSPLTHLGLIRASGAEAESFLQNQLSNDVRQLAPGRAQLSSYNSPKGRVLDLFALRRDREAQGDVFVLETRRDTLPASLKRLRMFVLRSKVVLEDGSDAGFALGLAGADAAALIEQTGLPLPAQDWEHMNSADGVTVMRRPGARYSLHGTPAQLEALWPKLAVQARPVGSAAWRLLDVLAGLPAIRPETADHFVAQMLNLDQLGAISFSKGCYPGQEIVARMHYLGNLKRRMFLCRTSAAGAQPGADVYAEGSESAAGEVVHAAPHPDGGTALLAVLQLAQAEAPLRLGSAGGATLKVVAAPAPAAAG
jgi:folate-binding protein YgfZ